MDERYSLIERVFSGREHVQDIVIWFCFLMRIVGILPQEHIIKGNVDEEGGVDVGEDVGIG
jgi:hypothetical protein